ncbi:MAG: TIGR03668 family PPOX class F420-dependent oxidoreductase [Acidimicrobiales bacterium]
MDGPMATLDGARARVARARVARLATSDPGGRADLVPITFALVGADTALRLVTAVDHKPKSTRRLRRLDHIRDRPEVALLVDHYDDHDWDRLWWIRIRGTARVIDAEGEGRALVDALVAKYAQYRETRPAGPVIEVTPTAWQWWSATGRAGRWPTPSPTTEQEQP